MPMHKLGMLAFLVLPVLLPVSGAAQPPRVLPKGKQPADTRLGPLKGERGNFNFKPATSPAEWKPRAARVRRMMRVALGLWPMPAKTPLHAVVHGRIDCGNYTVEKVYFQSLPGFYVTGNLYRPKGKSGRRPAVLSPHGHFPGGRFIDVGSKAVRQQIADGAERFEDGGRSFMQSRCVQLARMGCVVLHYDMIGYGDSMQIPLETVHRFSRLRGKFKTPPRSGFYSAPALLNLQNPMGLHTWNSIRALDFLTSLPDVDPKRVAVTGGSGGGTQTFMLCAVDDRPLVSVPVVIVSTTRQGGCTCENICGLRIGTYNLEFTALHAPKPLLLISADDATRTMAKQGFPELKRHYAALNATNNVAHKPLLHFPHNYNAVSRTAMYGFLNRHLKLGLEEPILERPYKRLTREQLTVWDKDHPRPRTATSFEKSLVAQIGKDARRQIAALKPIDAESLKRYRRIVGGAWDVLLRRLPRDARVAFAVGRTSDHRGHRMTLGLLRYATIEGHRAEIPMVLLVPKKNAKRTVIWIDTNGKSGLFNKDGSLEPNVERLLKAGRTVIGLDLFQQGEFLKDGRLIKRQRMLKGEDGFAGWTYCYNLTVFARRVHDIQAAIDYVKKNRRTNAVDLLGGKGAGHLAAAAVALSRGRVNRAAIDTNGFRFSKLTDVYDVDFQPGAGRYGDVPGLLALAAPTKIRLAGERENGVDLVRAAFRAAGSPHNLSLFQGPQAESTPAAVRWLLAE